ncbi:MAG: PKD domain-containing protein [Candidatus Bathyarchaeota archaeon]|nr:PKD domain-containing protein [Candidatus Bathyarchaeota archaeon]
MKLNVSSIVAMLLIVILLCSPLLMFQAKSSYTSKLYPISDSWVEAEFPNDTHGSDNNLRVKSDSRTRRSYLKFDLNSIPNGKTITSVKLYLYCTYADANPSVEIYVHETGDDWNEASITWNNAPTVGASITSISVGGTGRYYCWDITLYGQTQYLGDKILSVVVKLLLDNPAQDNPNLARYFASKEYTCTAQDPYLEVIYENTPPTASFVYSPTYPVENDPVAFDASISYDPDGSIVTYCWDFGDGNITTVTTSVIEHAYTTYGNYTVTLTVTDNDGLTGICTQIVEVVDPAILRVSLPEGMWIKQSTGDPWIDEGWLLNKTGNSWSFTVKIYDTSKCLKSYDTHLIVVLNNASYNTLQSLTINGTSIPKTAFKYGTPKPYGTKYWPSGCVYKAWFNDTYINVGKIEPKGYHTLTVSVTFSDATGARMHFDAYGSVFSWTPCSWSDVTWSPHSEDSTVLYQAGPLPLSVSISPASAVIDLGQQVIFTSSVSGGTPPYTYQWYLDGTPVGTNSNTWTFTPASTGIYQVYLNVTDNVGVRAKSNIAQVTVNPALSVSIQPLSSIIILGDSVYFTSTVSGGTPPYTYQWYLNDTEVAEANSAAWNFTPTSVGYYHVSLKVTDGASAAAMSNEAEVTVNPRTYKLTITATSGGTTTPTPGTYTYNEGTNVQVTAVTDTNYKLAYWELNGSNIGSNNPIIITMNNNYELKAYFALITYTLTITSTTGGTTNPAPGTHTYPSGSYVEVTAIPSANYFFDHWVLDGSNAGSANPISVYMNANHNLQAVFSLINWSLTITASAGGTTSPAPGTYVYSNGSSVSVTALPDVNYKFIKWQLNGSDVGSANPYTLIIDANYILHAVFQQLTYRLTILSSTGGTTNPGPGTQVYVNGTNVSVDAIPDAYYVLDYWLLDGNNVGSADPIYVLMTDDHTLQPIFARVNYTLTITATTGGTTTPAPGTHIYNGGTTVDVTAMPNAGYRFDHWVLDGSNAGSDLTIHVFMDTDHNLQAVFAETHTLIISVSQGGTTNPAPGTYTYDYPTDVTVTAIPNANYRFDHWEFDSNNIGSANPITVHVGSTHTLRAVFTLITYTLTIQTTAGGTTNPAPGTYTYNAGSMVLVTASPSTGYVFDVWQLDGVNVSSATSYTVTMNSDHTLKAVFKSAPTPPSISASITPVSTSIPVGGSVTFTSTVSGGTLPYSYQWYLNGAPVPGATSATWMFTPSATGTYNVYVNVTDSGGMTAKSNIATVSVTKPGVGGYSMLLNKQAPSSYFVVYTSLLAVFAAALVIIKRKRK